MFDVTVVSPLQQAYLGQASMGTSGVFDLVERRKRRRNLVEMSVNALHKAFTPLVVTTYGCWSDTARSTVMAFARETARRAGSSPSEVVARMFARLNFKLMRANARSILDRLPPLPMVPVG